ncbi:MAG: methionyl-tRNA formyltransferase [Thermoanaerobaculia bacterium]
MHTAIPGRADRLLTRGQRTIVFGSGSPLSLETVRILARRSDLAGVVLPAARRRAAARLASWWRTRDLRRTCRRLGVPLVGSLRDPGLGERLIDLAPEVLWVASFPDRIPPEILRIPAIAPLNVHFSLLPKHRGTSPLFWTYLHDDHVTGVSIHRLTDELDAGEIVIQKEVPLDRGVRGHDLYASLIEVAADLIEDTMTRIEEGRLRWMPQDPLLATSEPAPARGGWSIDWKTWSSERLWHFLRGVGDRDARFALDSRPVGPAKRYELRDHGRSAGEIEWSPRGCRIYCRDGYVDTEGLSLIGRLRQRVPRSGPEW